MTDLSAQITQLDKTIQLQLQHMTTIAERSQSETDRRLGDVERRLDKIEEEQQEADESRVRIATEIKIAAAVLTVGLPILMAAVDILLHWI